MTTFKTAIVMSSIGLVYSFVFLRESPKFYMNKKRYEEARENIDYISRFNGTPL